MFKRSLMAMAMVAGLGGIGAVAAPMGSANAEVVYSDNFNDYQPGGSYGTQAGSDTVIHSAGGSLAGWTAFGAYAVEAEELTSGDWAPTFWSGGGQGITTDIGASANVNNTIYDVKADIGPAVSWSINQATAAGDGVQFLLTDGAGNVLADDVFNPATYAQDPSFALSPIVFTYWGDGIGDLTMLIESSQSNGDFGGAVDNLEVFFCRDGGRTPFDEPDHDQSSMLAIEYGLRSHRGKTDGQRLETDPNDI